eukprot:1150862-Pelagomonas_calceolata.AAC.7
MPCVLTSMCVCVQTLLKVTVPAFKVSNTQQLLQLATKKGMQCRRREAALPPHHGTPAPSATLVQDAVS